MWVSENGSGRGENVFSRGSVEGDTWTWNNEVKMGGKLTRVRFTLKTGLGGLVHLQV
jgi:hypothetical protein